MAKRSKTLWLVAAVSVLILTQIVLLGFVVARSFSKATAVQAQQPRPRVNGEQRVTPPSPGRPQQSTSSRRTVTQKAPPRQKPVGPRAAPPVFSKTGGVFTNTVSIDLKAKSPNAIIRYTLDGSEPKETSATYSNTIVIKDTRLLRAACFEPGLAPSLVVSHAYRMLDEDLFAFSSNLPLVVIDTFNQPIGFMDYSTASVRFISPDGSRANLLADADYDGRIDLKRRGFTSLRFPKMSFTLKMRNDDGEKVKARVFGLPDDSDWVLYAPYVDKTLIRDVLGYELSNSMGRYAPRTRLVEVFIHRSSSPLTARDYAGVYVLVEKIKRSKDRVDIAKLKPEDNTEPEISGGYILKRDHGAMKGGRNFGGNSPPRPSNDGVGFITPRGLHLFHVEPDEDELTEAQKKWVARYFTDFERALHGSKFTDPHEGYSKYLDVDAFIDHFWLVELTKNVDAFRYSAYLQKPRGGKIIMGPAWDWNLSFGNADYYDAYETGGWYYENLRDIEISWIYRLKQDPDFMQRCTDRWAELRRDIAAPDRLLARVDALRSQLQEAQQRNFRKWPVMGREIRPNYFVGPTYDAEINWMKIWIKDRIAWIDRQFPPVPRLSEKPGTLAPGTKLKLTAGTGEIYYTTDGTDPRARGGSKAKAAQKYSGPIAVDGTMKLNARVLNGGSWSAPTSGTFLSSKGTRASAD